MGVRKRDRVTVPGRRPGRPPNSSLPPEELQRRQERQEQKKAANVAELVHRRLSLALARVDKALADCRECACCELTMPPGRECGWADEAGTYYCKFCWHDWTGEWTPRGISRMCER